MRTHRLIANLCAAVLVLIISLGVLGVAQMVSVAKTNSQFAFLLSDEVSRLQALRTLTAELFQVNRICVNTLLLMSENGAATGSQIDAAAKRSAELLANQAKIMEIFQNSNLHDSMTFRELENGLKAYALDVGQFFEIVQRGDVEAARAYRLAKLRPKIDAINDLLGELSDAMGSTIAARSEIMSQAAKNRSVAVLLFSAWPFLVILISIIWIAIVTFRYLASADTASELPIR